MSLFDLKGKTAIITGSSRGIGKSIAEQMAAHGAKVVISSRKLPICEEVAAELNAKHGDGTAIAVACNISSKDDLQNLVDETKAAMINGMLCMSGAKNVATVAISIPTPAHTIPPRAVPGALMRRKPVMNKIAAKKYDSFTAIGKYS